MAVDEAAVLREVAGELRRGERFEQVLGKVVRRHGGTYGDYIRLIGKVRERSRKRNLTLAQAARSLREK